MRVSLVMWCAVAVGLAVVALGLSAYSAYQLSDVAQKVGGLQGSVDEIKRDVVVTRADLRAAIQSELAPTKRELGAAKRRLDALEGTHAQLAETVRDTTNQLFEEQRSNRDILLAISRKDRLGRAVPNVAGSMEQSDEFRREMNDLIRSATPNSRGTLWVDNQTDSTWRLFVNGREERIYPGWNSFAVDAGQAITELPGEWPIRHRIAAPNYEATLRVFLERIRPPYRPSYSSATYAPVAATRR